MARSKQRFDTYGTPGYSYDQRYAILPKQYNACWKGIQRRDICRCALELASISFHTFVPRLDLSSRDNTQDIQGRSCRHLENLCHAFIDLWPTARGSGEPAARRPCAKEESQKDHNPVATRTWMEVITAAGGITYASQEKQARRAS
jgi:hypothetical protein